MFASRVDIAPRFLSEPAQSPCGIAPEIGNKRSWFKERFSINILRRPRAIASRRLATRPPGGSGVRWRRLRLIVSPHQPHKGAHGMAPCGQRSRHQPKAESRTFDCRRAAQGIHVGSTSSRPMFKAVHRPTDLGCALGHSLGTLGLTLAKRNCADTTVSCSTTGIECIVGFQVPAVRHHEPSGAHAIARAPITSRNDFQFVAHRLVRSDFAWFQPRLRSKRTSTL
jgi:hypothetical protein